MIKRGVSFVIVLIIAFLWVITLTSFLKIGPIKDKISLGLDISGGVYVVMEADTKKTGKALDKIMDQAQAVIERRVNLMGLSEPVVTVEGNKRIRIELPGAKDSKEAIDMIGKTAQLEFKMANGDVILDGSQVKNSSIESDQQNGGYAVTLEFNSKGAKAFEKGTTDASSNQVKEPFMEGIKNANQIAIVLDGEIISAPNASQPISGGNAIITGGTGGFTEDEAMALSTLIRGGALPVPLKEVEASQVGASIGMGALSNSILGGVIGICLIFVLMILVYRLLGLASCVALLFYVPAMLWIIVVLRGVLTLPGIAGIILSVGMAVDANVIIFSRVREEVQGGKIARVAMREGFRRAMGTIIDSQLTTMIAGVILYIFGTGPVRGFALTLMIGIILGIISAIGISNAIINAIMESEVPTESKLLGFKPNKLDAIGDKKFGFLQRRKIYYIATAAILVIGFGVGLVRGYNFGIDFTGGTRIDIDYKKNVSHTELSSFYKKQGLENVEVVDSGTKKSQIMVKTTTSLNQDKREVLLKKVYKAYNIKAKQVLSFEQFGPAVGDSLKFNAIRSVLIAALFMLLYIIFRFKWRFGIAAIIAVFHDVLIMCALYGLFNMSINNPFIAAILTVVGYSINDTIVVFDRIRENVTKRGKDGPQLLIDKSINQTLVRSIMTSITTVLAIMPLVILGGESIREFTIPLIIGIVAGTFSSIFIASPIYYDILTRTSKGKGYLELYAKPKEKKPEKVRDNDGAVV